MDRADLSELRTPLHQILAITQLLRSSMNDLADAPQQMPTTCLNTMQQIRDLLPFLDAIDTSGKTLHGIVDNILSFLDLKANDSMVMAPKPSLMNSPFGAAQSIEVMFEELVQEAWEEDKRSRRANGQPIVNIETVFEIIPPLLGGWSSVSDIPADPSHRRTGHGGQWRRAETVSRRHEPRLRSGLSPRFCQTHTSSSMARVVWRFTLTMFHVSCLRKAARM